MIPLHTWHNQRRLLLGAVRRWEEAVVESRIQLDPHLCPSSPDSLSEMAFYMEEDEPGEEKFRCGPCPTVSWLCGDFVLTMSCARAVARSRNKRLEAARGGRRRAKDRHERSSWVESSARM